MGDAGASPGTTSALTGPDQGAGEPAQNLAVGGGRPPSRANPWWFRAGFYGLIGAIVFTMFQDLPSELVGGLGIGLMLVLLVMKVPVAVAMGFAGGLGVFVLSGTRVLAVTFQDVPFRSVGSWSLSVLPMFIFMGLLLWRSGATEKLYDATREWLGWLPGGLAVGTNFAGAGLAAVSGSTLGVTYALGRIGVPEMLRAGYDRRLATASILMAGTGGQLIPPSILLVIYAGIVSIPVGPQLLAGFVPGVLLAVVYGTLIVAVAAMFPRLTGRGRRGEPGIAAKVDTSWSGRWTTLAKVWPIPVLAISVLFGLYMGVFTATEAGAVGALGAIFITGWYLRLTGFVTAVRQALGDTVKATGGIFLLLVGAMILNRLLTLSGAASWTARFIDELGLGRVQFLLVMLLIYLILGMFMDPLTMMLITVPILMPTIAALDISLIWFGVFVVLLGELSIITPPVGILTFIVHRLVQDDEVNLGHRISLADVFVGVLWFIPASVGVLVILILFPELAEWLPNAMRR